LPRSNETLSDRHESKGALVNLKLTVAILAIAAIPLGAQAQKADDAKITKADAEKVVQIISSDKAKTQIYCQMLKLSDEVAQADQKSDNKKVDELGQKIDELSDKLGPEYVDLVEGLQDLDPDSKEAEAIGALLDGLDKLCPN
jgi:hypothetical protein